MNALLDTFIKCTFTLDNSNGKNKMNWRDFAPANCLSITGGGHRRRDQTKVHLCV